MASIALPPFLEKLRRITKTTDPAVAGWSEDGTQFEVHSNRFEKEVLRVHFRGNRQTFIRQLHFYCFKKLDNKGEKWAFSHQKFKRDAPHLIYEIKRKTRTENGGPASKVEVQSIRAQLESVRANLQQEINDLKTQVSALLQNVEKQHCCQCSSTPAKRHIESNLMEVQSDGAPREEVQQEYQRPRKIQKEIKEVNYTWDEPVNPDEIPFSQSLPFDDYTSDLLDGTLLF